MIVVEVTNRVRRIPFPKPRGKSIAATRAPKALHFCLAPLAANSSDVRKCRRSKTSNQLVSSAQNEPMSTRLIVAVTLLAGLTLRANTFAQQAKDFKDGFDIEYDFLSAGTEGSGWDGLLGKGPRETADRIATADGKLYLQSTRGRYQEGWNPLGPLLYKTVTGDFKATVRRRLPESVLQQLRHHGPCREP